MISKPAHRKAVKVVKAGQVIEHEFPRFEEVVIIRIDVKTVSIDTKTKEET